MKKRSPPARLKKFILGLDLGLATVYYLVSQTNK